MDDTFDHFFVRPSDFDRTLHFYTEVLRWQLASSWGDSATGRGATLNRGRMQVAMAERHPGDVQDSSDRAVNGVRPSLYIAVDDLRARFAELSDPSVVVVPLERTHWGIEWFVVKDPDDNLLAFTQRDSR